MVERKYDSADKVEPIDWILVPPLVLLIENIIELSPCIEIPGDLEFKTGIQIESTSSLTVPGRLLATASHADGSQLSMEGEPGTFVMLSRPGPEGTRLHTAMGFAEFTLGDSKGAGMYEFSRRVGLSAGGKDQEDGEK